MKQSHTTKPNRSIFSDIRMAAAVLTTTAVIASRVFRPLIRAGVAIAAALALLLAAGMAGQKLTQRRLTPWEKVTRKMRRLRPVKKSRWSFRF